VSIRMKNPPPLPREEGSHWQGFDVCVLPAALVSSSFQWR